MTVLIFANGDINNLTWVSPYFATATAVIGVDGGTHHIVQAGGWPDVVIGDLDSLAPSLLGRLQTSQTTIKRYPRAKNETDLELALLFATNQPEWQHQQIFAFGVTGGRLDQTIGNVFLLAHQQLHGRTVKFISQHQTTWLITDQTDIHGRIGDTISLLPLGGDCHIHTTTGLRWDLHNEQLRFGPARGVSNQLTSQTAHVSLKSGSLLCIHTNQEWQR